MPGRSAVFGAFIGTTLMALSLIGSYGSAASSSLPTHNSSIPEVQRLHDLGKTAMSEGRYRDAREAFRMAATVAAKGRSARDAAMNWSNAGYASASGLEFGPAFEDLTKAREVATAAGEMIPLSYALTNMASLYLQLGEAEEALRICEEALEGPAGGVDRTRHARLIWGKGLALAMLGRFEEAEPVLNAALRQLQEAGDRVAEARCAAALGEYYIEAGRYGDAEPMLRYSVALSKQYQLGASANGLGNLARLRGKQGNTKEAERLYQQAFDTHELITPQWDLYSDRGRFRMETGNMTGALDDFRKAHRLAMDMRADIVPADQDRVSLENRVARVFEGFVNSGNRVALAAHDTALAAETFDVAEQDRMWSLRALLPEADDWRTHLPAGYWELLARYQALEGSLVAAAKPGKQELEKRAAELNAELKGAEIAAGSLAGSKAAPENAHASHHVQSILDGDSVLFSFSITKTSSWLWTIERNKVAIYALPGRNRLEREAKAFTEDLRSGRDSTASGLRLYGDLFGGVRAASLAQKRWFLEPDGPLYDVPFAALPVEGPAAAGGRATFLIERAALESIPGALLMEKGGIPASGEFVGVGDPVFNAADARYSGRTSRVSFHPGSTPALPRLPNTAEEISSCARAFGASSPKLLTGRDANVTTVASAMGSAPAVIHFATHVVTAAGDFRSGLIMLGLDADGSAGLLGPKDIAARRTDGALIVMNGCHSGQGSALPASGLMGLTRAWIGAGAAAVIATKWDVPDDAAQSLMVNFYSALRRMPGGRPAQALQAAQLAALHSGGPDSSPMRWAAYSLVSRI